MKTHLVILTISLKFALCRDFYVGMFKKNDFLVAQDTLYKEKNSFGFTVAKYGRIFNCPITYFRVSDRLGMGRPPVVQVNRGGLQKKYLTLILTSSYRMPIAVNIYVGCANTMTTKAKLTTKAQTKTTVKGITTSGAAKETAATANDTVTTAAEAPGKGTTPGGGEDGGDSTTVDPGLTTVDAADPTTVDTGGETTPDTGGGEPTTALDINPETTPPQ